MPNLFRFHSCAYKLRRRRSRARKSARLLAYMPLTSFPCPNGWSTASAPSLTLSVLPPSPSGGALSPNPDGSPASPIGVSTAWLAEENNLLVESLPSLPSVPRRPGNTLGKTPDDPSKRVSPDFEKIRSEIAIHRRLDFLARRRHAAASFAAEAQRTKEALDSREQTVRDFERQRQTGRGGLLVLQWLWFFP